MRINHFDTANDLPNCDDDTNLEPYKNDIVGIVVDKGLKHSDDNYDAFWLAHLLRLGILPEGYIYPKYVMRDQVAFDPQKLFT